MLNSPFYLHLFATAIVEKDFKKRVKALEKKQIEELRALELKYKTKQTAEENRHRLLKEEIEV